LLHPASNKNPNKTKPVKYFTCIITFVKAKSILQPKNVKETRLKKISSNFIVGKFFPVLWIWIIELDIKSDCNHCSGSLISLADYLLLSTFI
jgi:hypothetical protein